jgi:predicted HAD superfamily Cof-like phosphohydrolase
MSAEWFKDMEKMHAKYGVDEWMQKVLRSGNKDILRRYLAFRLLMLHEELQETASAALVQDNAEEVVDGLIDLIVFAIGTLEVFGVDGEKAWDAVYEANMNKSVGVKKGRPNPFGMPDLIKSEDWTPPSHETNHGFLSQLFGLPAKEY